MLTPCNVEIRLHPDLYVAMLRLPLRFTHSMSTAAYGTLVTEFPQQEKRKRKPKIALNSDDETENDEPQHQNKRPHGPIAKMKFYRIILDEGEV